MFCYVKKWVLSQKLILLVSMQFLHANIAFHTILKYSTFYPCLEEYKHLLPYLFQNEGTHLKGHLFFDDNFTPQFPARVVTN